MAIPTTQSADDIYTDFAAEYVKLILELSTQFTTFRSTYFPDEQAAYAAAEDWLQAAITNDHGLPSAVAAQILTDDKDRIIADAARASTLSNKHVDCNQPQRQSRRRTQT